MDYREELKRLKKEQDRLDSINEEVDLIFKKIWYSIIVVFGGVAIAFLLAAWQFLVKTDQILIAVAVLQDVAMIIALVIANVFWFLDLEDNVDALDDFLSNLRDAAELRKGEKERKAKIEFFERLENDPDFRKAWEEQMSGMK